jgi:hypothetical protein
LLVEDDADSGFSNIVDDTSLAVVDLVGHADWRLEYCSRTGDLKYCVSRGFHLPFLDGTVCDDIDDITDPAKSVSTDLRKEDSLPTHLYCLKYVERGI